MELGSRQRWLLTLDAAKDLLLTWSKIRAAQEVVGINISPEQIAKAKDDAAAKGKLGTVLEFQRGPHELEKRYLLKTNGFDAAYIVQASPYAHDFTALLAEVRRVHEALVVYFLTLQSPRLSDTTRTTRRT